MAIQYPNFRADPGLRPDFSGVSNLGKNIAAGYQIGTMPAQIRQQREAQAIQQALQQQQMQKAQAQTQLYNQQAQFYPSTAAANISAKQAQENLYGQQAALASARANQIKNPGADDLYRGMTGDVGNVVRAHRMIEEGKKRGDENLIANGQRAIDAIDYQHQVQNSLMKLREQYSNPMRYSTPMSKYFTDKKDVADGYYPGTGRKLKIDDPEKQKEMAGQLEVAQIKQMAPAQVATKNLMASQIEQTLNGIDPKALTDYSGISGTIARKSNALIAPFGGESKEYDKLQTSLKNLEYLVGQVRQYYGESVQPEMIHRIESLLNPARWYKNPKLAMKEYRAVEDTLRSELQTYRGALKSAQAYTGEKPSAQDLSGNKELSDAEQMELLDRFFKKNPDALRGLSR